MQLAPVGTYTPRDRCIYCGDRWALEMFPFKALRAWAWRCEDRRACESRQNAGRQMRLFGSSVK